MSNRSEIRIGNMRFNSRSRDLLDAGGKRIELRNKSSEVLSFLAEQPEGIVSKADIMEAVWPDVTVTDESLTQCISEIRRAIGDKDQTLLVTHVGKGYSLNTTPPQPAGLRLANGLWIFSAATVLLIAFAVWFFWPEPEPDGPTRIAVLAFEDLSTEEDRGYLSDSIAEGIITELARYPELAVIARNSSFSFRDKPTDITEIAQKLDADFVVEGSMQKSGDLLKVTIQLISGHDGAHVWAHEFNDEIDDFFEVQSNIVLGVATKLGRDLAWYEPETGGPQRVSALHLYLRGNGEFNKQTRESIARARDLYLEAIEADPTSPYGHIGMALIVWQVIPQPWLYEDMSRADLLRMGVDHAEKALALDPDNYAAHIARGDMHDRAGEHDLAVIRYQNAASLNPSSADAMVLASEPLMFLGRIDEAKAVLERAIDINPVTPEWYFKSMAFVHWAAGECDKAVGWIKKKSRFRPWDLRHLMVGQACAGDLEGAQETVAKHLAAEPDYTVRTYRERNTKSFEKNPELLERFLSDMLKAGMPAG